MVGKYSTHYNDTRDNLFLVLDQMMAYTLEPIMAQVREIRLNKQAQKAAKQGKGKNKTKKK